MTARIATTNADNDSDGFVELPIDRDVPMESENLIGLQTIARKLERPLAQIQLLSAAKALGPSYSYGDVQLYSTQMIEKLVRRKHWDKKSLTTSGLIPGKVMVLLRQIAAEDFQTPDSAGRQWYGYSRDADISTDPVIHAQQDAASRMWWPISPARRDQVNAIAAQGGIIPCLISVGGLIVSAREITGFDFETSQLSAEGSGTPARWAFNIQPAGDWFNRDLRNQWLSSGPGKPILWWDLPNSKTK